MTCATCAQTIQRSLEDPQGVESANVNLATERATVVYDPDKVDVDKMGKAVKDAGYDTITSEVTLGEQRLQQVWPTLRGGTAIAAGRALLSDVEQFIAGEPQEDDLSLLVIQRKI